MQNLVAEIVTPSKVMLSWSKFKKDRDTYKIYRAYSDSDDYKLIGQGRATIFIDENEGIYKNRPKYKVYSTIYDNYSEAIPTQYYDKYSLGLAHMTLVKLKNHNYGRVCKVFLKSDTFEDCPECFSSVMEKQFTSTCSTCDGSGKINGLQGPVEIYINVSTAQKEIADLGDKEKKIKIYKCWTGNIPRVREGDLVWLANNEIGIIDSPPVWVEKLNNAGTAKCLIKQSFVIKILNADNQAYDLDWGL